jgi:hypothetical protein
VVVGPISDAGESSDVVGERGRRGTRDRGLSNIGGDQLSGCWVGELDLPVGEVGGVVGPDDIEALGGVDGVAGGGLQDFNS